MGQWVSRARVDGIVLRCFLAGHACYRASGSRHIHQSTSTDKTDRSIERSIDLPKRDQEREREREAYRAPAPRNDLGNFMSSVRSDPSCSTWKNFISTVIWSGQQIRLSPRHSSKRSKFVFCYNTVNVIDSITICELVTNEVILLLQYE